MLSNIEILNKYYLKIKNKSSQTLNSIYSEY